MPDEINSPGILFWRRPTLARPIAVLPSGLQRFTAVFGMGTGGATALLSPEISAECFGANFWWRRCARRVIGEGQEVVFLINHFHLSLFTWERTG